MKITPSWVYRLNPAVAIEDFGERSLVLHCDSLQLIVLNVTARGLLNRLDGQTSLDLLAQSIAKDYNQPFQDVLVDVKSTIARLAKLNIAERVQQQSPD
jgi:hypothetical protein